MFKLSIYLTSNWFPMGEGKEVAQETLGARPIKVIERLPTPEEVFKVPKLTWRTTYFIALGPALIAVGDALGSGEWVFGTAIFVRYGLTLAWITWLIVLCQAIYQIMWTKVIIWYGEIPAVFMSRLPGGPKFWSWWVIINHALRIAWPGWALGAGTGIAAMILGRAPGAADARLVQTFAAILFAIVVLILLFGGKVARIVELTERVIVYLIIAFAIFLVAVVISPVTLAEYAQGLVSIGSIPPGMDILLFGAFVGYFGSALFHNWYNVAYYRDKGYGAGSIVGFIPSAIGGLKIYLSPIGVKPKYTKENIEIAKRWLKLVKLDQLLHYFLICTFVGVMPALAAASVLPRGTVMGPWEVAVFMGEAVANKIGPWGFYLVAILGLLILFSTQLMLSDNLARNIVEVLWSTNEGVRKWAKGDVRRVYYSFLVIYVIIAIAVIFSGLSPFIVLAISANVPHFMAFWTLPALAYIERKFLPKELRSPWYYWVFLGIMFTFSAVIFVGIIAYYGFGIKIF